jgi:hypothetical protein
MEEITRFAHGFHYGDFSGVVFYGPPFNGFWLDRLAVSDCYIGPLFRAILDREWRESGGESLLKVLSEWNTLTGWADIGAGIVPLTSQEAEELCLALSRTTAEDLAIHVAGVTVTDCLECAAAIRAFIHNRLVEGKTVSIEND